ncbi:MAG: zinc metallopeptidase [Clostridia bacterium]|nr:zinc metallopeptidase [Clostridia bacterium]
MLQTFDIVYYIASALLLPMIIYSFYVSYKVNKTFRDFAGVFSHSGLTAAEVAQSMLERAGINDVSVERVNGNLTDHYNPKDKTVYLSDSVYTSSSVAAIGVAAHETGHAVQHSTGYAPLKIRTAIVPFANVGSRLAIPLIIVGAVLGVSTLAGIYLVYVGIAFYALTTLFMLVTLPVEFNASRRAKKMLYETGILQRDEIDMADAVLSAAAKTYVASFAVSLLYLIRFMGIFLRRRR